MLIHYKCEKCEKSTSKYYRKSKDIEDEVNCECGDVMDRQLGAPNQNSTQFIDNGLNARKVEVSSTVVEQEKQKLYKED